MRYLPTSARPNGYAQNSAGQCVRRCTAGDGEINYSDGNTITLFAERVGTPAIHVRQSSTKCFADMTNGDGKLTLISDGDAYTATAADWCMPTYKLSFDCGDGGLGTPPPPRYLHFGETYTTGYNIGGCHRPGYRFSLYYVNGSWRRVNTINIWTFTSDRVATIQWLPQRYPVFYDCTGAEYIADNTSVRFDAKLTPSVSVCNDFAPDGMVLAGYSVRDILGREKDDFIAAGDGIIYKYTTGIKLVPVWQPDTTDTSDEE